MEEKNLIFILLIFLVLPTISAYDNDTLQICAGDEQTLILCVGDLENSPIGKNVYDAPNVTDRTGGTGTGGSGARFDSEIICRNINDFLLENIINETTTEQLLFRINNESGVFISKNVLDQYIDNFEEMCNMTIEKEKEKEIEIVKKVAFPFLLILFIGLLIYSCYHRKKIIKWIIALFDDEEEDSLNLEGN